MRKLFIPLIAVFGLFCSCSQENIERPHSDEPIITQESDLSSVLPGVAIVQFDEYTSDLIYEAMGGDYASNEQMTKAFVATKSSNSDQLLQELGLSSIRRVFSYSPQWEKRHRAEGLHTWFQITYDNNVPQTKAHEGLSTLNGVINIEPQYAAKTTASIPFNDPYSNYQWNLNNSGAQTGFRPGIDINVIPVWKDYTTGSSDVIISVVDTGVAINHPELTGVVIPGTENGGSRSFVYDEEGPTLTDDEHGTHVSAIIGAINNNRKGICGIAGGGTDGQGGVRIIASQIMEEIPDSDETKQGNTADAIIWGADHGAVISQNSWGYSGEPSGIGSADKLAIDYFIKWAGCDEDGNQLPSSPMKGGVVIFAAGNESQDKAYPAMYEPVIAVGAIGPNGKRTSYSNYGDWVDICAPGGEYEGYSGYDSFILSAAGSNDYILMCGTSQACPHVSGVAALLVSHFGGQGFTNEMLKDKLIFGANYNAPSKNERIGPMLDAYGAFQVGEVGQLELKADKASSITIRSHESLQITVSPTSGWNDIEYKYTSSLSGISTQAVNGNYVLSIDALKNKPGTYALTVNAQALLRNSSISFEITILPNNPPTVKGQIENIISEDKQTINIDLKEYFEDLDSESLTYSFSVSNTRIANVSAKDDILSIKPSSFGQTDITLTASDARNSSCSMPVFSFYYYDMEKGATAYPNPVEDYLRVSAGKEKEMRILITNPNGAVLYDKTLSASVIQPAKVDMRGFAPGRYNLSVFYDGTKSNKSIVKK